MNRIEKIIEMLHYLAIFIFIIGPIYTKTMTIFIPYIIFWIILLSFNTYTYLNNKDRFRSKNFRTSFIIGPIIPLLGLLAGILVGLYK